MDAARAASAPEFCSTSAICCKVPHPPEAMNGTETALETAFVRVISYPSFVPSEHPAKLVGTIVFTYIIFFGIQDAIAWAKKASMMGAGEILLTSIDADGTKDGYEITLTKAVSKAVSVPVIASGGCGTLQHMADVLQNSGADAALAASIFHYDSHGLCTAKQFLKDQGISVRPCDKML